MTRRQQVKSYFTVVYLTFDQDHFDQHNFAANFYRILKRSKKADNFPMKVAKSLQNQTWSSPHYLPFPDESRTHVPPRPPPLCR